MHALETTKKGVKMSWQFAPAIQVLKTQVATDKLAFCLDVLFRWFISPSKCSLAWELTEILSALGKKYGGPIDLYSSYLSSSNHQAWNQYCNKGYAQKPQITTKDLDNAFAYAWNEVQGYIKNEVNVGQHGS